MSVESGLAGRDEIPALAVDVVRGLRSARLAKTAASSISSADLVDEIRRMRPAVLDHVRRELRLRRGASPATIAQSTKTRLAQAPEELAAIILHDVFARCASYSAATEELDVGQLAALLAGDPANLAFLSDTHLLSGLLTERFGSSGRARAAVWSSLVSGGYAGSTAALAWLVAAPPAHWSAEQGKAASSAWERVVEAHPRLPAQPTPFDDLVELVVSMDRDQVFDQPAEPDEEISVTGGPAGDSTITTASLDDLAQTCAAVCGEDLPAIGAALSDGRLPAMEHLGRMMGLVEDMAALFGRASTEFGGGASSLDAVRDLVEGAQAVRSAIERVRTLVHLAGPPFAEKEVRAVSDLAGTIQPDSDPELITALDAVEAAVRLGPSDDKAREDELTRVTSVLPSAGLIAWLANNGHLTLKSAESADDASSADDDPPSADSPPAQPSPADDLTTATEAAPELDAEAVTAEVSLQEAIADLAFTLPDAASDEQEPRSTTPLRPEKVQAAGNEDTAPVEPVAHETGTGAPELITALVTDGQFALAHWACTALGEDPAISAAYRLAAHAAAMRTSVGSNASSFAEAAKQLDTEVLSERLDLQLLVYAASVRAGLLSPLADAAGPLRDASKRMTRAGTPIDELTDALLVAFYSGAYLTPRSAGAVAEAVEAEGNHESLAKAAETMLRTAPSRTILYAVATDLWQKWMKSTGYLGEALTVVARGSREPDDVAVVRQRVAALRSRQTLESAIDDDVRKLPSARRGKKVEARARTKIRDWAGEVADLLADWVELTDSLNQAAGATWMADPMADLRGRVNAVKDGALRELEALITDDPTVRNAVLRAGMDLLRDSLGLIEATSSLTGPEVSADRVISGPLSLATSLPLTSDLQPRRDVTIDDVNGAASVLRMGEDGWLTAFRERAAAHDQVGTKIIIELLRSEKPELAQRLTNDRDHAVATSIADLDRMVGALTTSIDSDRYFGRLTFEQWADLSTRARAYEAKARGARGDFDQMRAAVDLIERERAAYVDEVCAVTAKEVEGAEIPEVARERILACIAAGDITTANEYRETVRANRELPDTRSETNHLRLFYPAFPTRFSSQYRGGVRGGWFGEIKEAITARRNPVGGDLVGLLAGADLDVADIARSNAATNRIDQWIALSGAKSLESKMSDVKAVLEQLGFFVDKQATPHSRKGQKRGRSAWLHLVGVRATSGKALIPAFGSRISPSGDTLRLLAVWQSPTPQELVQLLEPEPTDHSVIVLYFGTLDATARRELANQFHRGRRLPVTAVVDEAAFAYLVLQPEAGRDITMSITLPFASASPFTPDVAGLVAQEMFFGRAEERDKVVDMMGSCIVYGGRQLGKSALLRAADREFNDGAERHAIYESIFKVGQSHPVDAVWTLLWTSLARKDSEIVPDDIPSSGDVATILVRHIEEWIAAKPGRQLLLLLDESDSFLDADANSRFVNVNHFRNLMESTGRAVKVVFAGLHQTARFERLSNHPLAHFGDPVCVGPLAPQAAYDLLTQPLRALGYEFEHVDQAARVLALANNQPALIQLFGAQLLRNLHKTPLPQPSPPRIVTESDVTAVWADEGLRTAFRKRFDWTLNLDPRYKVIAYSVAFHAHSEGSGSTLTASRLRVECEQWWPQGFAAEDVRTGEFHALLDECVDLGVLSYADGGYRLRTPNVLDLLGSREEVYEVLDQAESMELPQSFDGSLLRPAFGGGITCGPLTSQQIADLLAPRNQVRLVTGSAALTIERCLKALKEENGDASGNRARSLVEAPVRELAKMCKQATAMRPAGGHAIVAVPMPKSVPRDVALRTWEEAREQIAVKSGGTLGIILITSPEQAPLWAIAAEQSDISSQVVGLRRIGGTDMRLWVNEHGLPFQDDASRGELLGITGGWPINVNKVAEQFTDGHEQRPRDALAQIRTQLATPDQAGALVTASGVRADEALHQAWSFLCSSIPDDEADQATLAWYLEEHAAEGGSRSAALTPDGLAELGYRGAADVVSVLRMLGVLVTTTSGHLRLEPVMAEATAIAVDTAGSAG